MQSRCYDPAIGRFLNADILVSTGQGLLGCNMFAYCNNSPVIHCDTSGAAGVISIDSESRILLPTDDVTSGGGIGSAVLALATVAAVVVVATSAEKTEDKTETLLIAHTITDTTRDDAIYFGADRYGGAWKIVTDGMRFEAAKAWVFTMAATKSYGKGASWGIYTTNQDDALSIVLDLGGPGPCLHEKRIGEYPHYHPTGMILFGQYKHFHVWYGSIYGG